MTNLFIYTGAGKTNDRVKQYIEIDKSLSIIDLGVAVGRNTLRTDTVFFAECKVIMDVCNFRILANEITIGAGTLFNSGKGSLILELYYNIFAQVSKHWGFGIMMGYFDFSNELTDTSKTFFGFYLCYGLVYLWGTSSAYYRALRAQDYRFAQLEDFLLREK